MTPAQVKDLSFWEFFSALDGYVKANTPEDSKLSESELDDLWAWMQEGDGGATNGRSS